MLEHQKSSAALGITTQLIDGRKCLNTNTAVRSWERMGLALTFLLSTISGGLLGGIQPPSGQGLPIVGWHLDKDIRPSHFLGVHAQQLIPLGALLAERFLGSYAALGLGLGSVIYVVAWRYLTWASLRVA